MTGVRSTSGTLTSGAWTTADIVSLDGCTAVVTGANSGLGYVTAVELARGGARVLLAVRSPERGRTALERLRADVPSATAEVVGLDLSDLSSVRSAAASVTARVERLDLLVCNAGVMAPPRSVTADGFESQLATNHLGHFALTGLLLSALLAAPDPRVVVVSSEAHRMGRIRFDDLQGERSYRRWRAYGQSKLSNLLYTFELQRRSAAAGTSLIAVAAHPGYAATELQGSMARASGSRLEAAAMTVTNAVIGQSAAMGALPQLYAATAPGLTGGEFLGPGGPGHIRGYPSLQRAAAAAYDESVARRLWEVSEELTGVRYEWGPGHT